MKSNNLLGRIALLAVTLAATTGLAFAPTGGAGINSDAAGGAADPPL